MNAHTLIRPLLAICAFAALPSCEVAPGAYGGYGGGGGYDDGPGYSSYSSRPYYSGSGGGYYSSGYSRPYYGGPRYYDNDHRYSSRDRDHDHDNDYRRSSNNNRSSSSSSRSDNEIRLVKVRDGTRGDVPEGYHSKEWYQKRGISLSKNTYETRDGDKRGYTGSSHSSSDSKKKKH